MKGRALSFEILMDLCSTKFNHDDRLGIKRSALSHFAAAPSYTSPPSALRNGEMRFKSSNSGELNAPQGRNLAQPLIHHPKALPIFAAFGLRYIHILVRKWAALATCSGCAPQLGMRPAEW